MSLTASEICKRYRERNKEKYYANQIAKRNTLSGRIKDMLHGCKTRAKQKGFEYNLSEELITNMYYEQDGKCAVTNLPMDTKSNGRKKANPFRISVDRINSEEGYTLDNVRLVCWAVNQMKADRTDDEFKFWIKALYRAISSQA